MIAPPPQPTPSSPRPKTESRHAGAGASRLASETWVPDSPQTLGCPILRAPAKGGIHVLFAALLALLALPAHAADHKAPPAKPAAQYAAFDAHPNERVTIAAEPCDDPKACAFFRLPYIQHGLLPVRVIVTNDSDRALSLDDARIQFLAANRDKLPAATDDEINRRLFTMRGTQDTKIPLIVVPLSIPIHHKPVDQKITDDNNDFGFQGTVVNPHTTLAGYLFYDIKELDDPALRHAELYLKQIHTLDGKQELFAFTIPFDRWLAANPATPSNQPRK